MTAIVAGLAPLARHYDGFILDVWGVLHNGERLYPGVLPTLAALREESKRVVLLSNAPVRASTVVRRLAKLGIDRGFYDDVLTSGEEVWQCLRSRPDAFYQGIGRRALLIGADRHGPMLHGLDLDPVTEAGEAEFLLNTGPDDLDEEVSLYREVLNVALARNLPMICANPDLTVMQGGDLIICAGTLAQHYAAMGGRVRWHGKPHGSVYATVLGLLGVEDRTRVLCVGDSLRTDIKGAGDAGLDSLFLAGGLHAGALGWETGGTLDPARLTAFIEGKPQPTWAMGELVW